MPVTIRIKGENKVEPEEYEVIGGGAIEWFNETSSPCTVLFADPSPFVDGARIYDISPGSSKLSGPIKSGPIRLPYKVLLWKASETGDGDRGSYRGGDHGVFGDTGPVMDPTIIVKDPHH